jgi:hypothetical protein
VKDILQIPTKEIILIGHSLGSAPTVHLAISKNYREIKAVILISPIASGVKLVSPDIKVEDLEKIDVFCNIRKVIDVVCPIFLVHGQKDEIIPVEQSIEMAKFIRNSYEWLPRNGDHNNIFTKYRTKFFQKCKFFFDYLQYYTNKQMMTNSFSTQNNCTNEKFYNDVFKNREIQVEESWYGHGRKINETISNPNGHPFSAKERMNSLEFKRPRFNR